MSADTTSISSETKPEKKRGFFVLDKRLFPKKSRTFHHEVHHATSDLIDVYNRAARTHLLCERTAKMLTKKDRTLLSPIHVIQDFESFTYHLENFWLRAFSYREKICQFINAALDLQYSEKAPLFQKLLEDTVVRRSGLKITLKRFDKVAAFKEVLLKRKMITHRAYYDTPTAGYDRQFRPLSKGQLVKKQWLQNMRKEIRLIESFIRKAFDLNDETVEKLADYRKVEKDLHKKILRQENESGDGNVVSASS